MNNLDQLGQRMAGLQDRQLEKIRQEASPTSAALGEHLLRRATERRRRRQMTWVSVTVVLVLGGALAGLPLWPMHHRATVATVRAQAGQRVAASALDLAVDFDDGSRIVLSSGASLRTEMVGPSIASLELERGRAAVRVMHTRSTHWTVHAGTYSVLVTGTRFHLDWRPGTEALSVVVEEGSVRVTGGLLAEAIDISAGQSLDLEQGHPVGVGGSVVPNRALAATPSQPALGAAPLAFMPSPLDTQPAAAPGHRPTAHHLATPSSPSSSSPSSWRQQAEAGHYRDALAEAERKGFDGICRESPGADLLTLAEAARYAGHAERAEQALKAVRMRFGHTEDAAVAAYLLGRIAAENRRDHSDAARWFRAYLAERPGGRLDREAEGRLLESLAFMDRNTAREAALAYLQHYPSGPHAAFARNLLGL